MQQYPGSKLRAGSFVRAVLASRPPMSLGALEFVMQRAKGPKHAIDLVHNYYSNCQYSSSKEQVFKALTIMHAGLSRC